MIIRAKYLSLLTLLVSSAYADEVLKAEFDKEQSSRLQEIQSALSKGDADAARNLARTQSQKVEQQLKAHGVFGPHQRMAILSFGSSLLTQSVLDNLKSFSMYEGQDISFVSNNYLMDNFGIELKYKANADKSKPGTWEATVPKDNAKVIKYFESNLGEDALKVWKSLNTDQKAQVVTSAVRQVGTDLQAAIPLDTQMKATMGAIFEKKSDELQKRIDQNKKDIVSAGFLDDSEKRMLASEKKAADALKDSKDARTLPQFCEEFASALDNPEDIKRRVDVISATDPCSEPLKKRLATVTAKASSETADRKPAVEETKSTGLYEDEEPEESKDKNEGTDEEKAQKKALADQAASDKKTKDLESQLQQMQQAVLGAQGERDTLKDALAMSQQCQRNVGSSGDPFGLNPDNQKNEKMIASLKDEMEKVLVDNYSAAVCEQANKSGNMRSAAENVLAGLVPEGALTEADQRKLKGVSQGALDQAGSFAKKRSSRMKLMAQLEETASKRALTRLTMEYSTLLNTGTVAYLKTLSHTDLVGVDGLGFGGALSKASTNPLDPTLTIQTYNSLYESALLDLTKKYGTGEDYEMNAECALTLAQVASSRWTEEAGRMTALMGPSRQNAMRSLGSLLTTDVKNAPTSEVDATKTYKKR